MLFKVTIDNVGVPFLRHSVDRIRDIGRSMCIVIDLNVSSAIS